MKPDHMLCWKCHACVPIASGLCRHCIEDSERAEQNLPPRNPSDVTETVFLTNPNPQPLYRVDFS